MSDSRAENSEDSTGAVLVRGVERIISEGKGQAVCVCCALVCVCVRDRECARVCLYTYMGV